MSGFVWSDAEREAYRLPDEITVADWADANRVLDPRTSAEPGQWRTARTPYLREIMDAFVDPLVEEITLMASTQCGKTESMYCMVGYAIDQDPGPGLLVMPREPDARTVSQNRLMPMLQLSPALASHLPNKGDDLTAMEFRMDRMILYLAGSNSPAALASKPVRYLWLDEVDKYPPFSGREADPIKLARERTRTFWNRKIVKVSTPTTRAGYIFREYEASDQRRYFIPCPHCGQYQPLVFGQVRWPEGAAAAEIVEDRLAWYECRQCQAKITDMEKLRALSFGVWVPDGCCVGSDGAVEGKVKGPIRHRGYWLSALYSPWLIWSEIAAEFLRSKDYAELLMNFVNSWLAEVWEEKTRELSASALVQHELDYEEKTAPDGVAVITAGVDVQLDHFYLIVRGWGANWESWLLRAVRIDSWEVLEDELLQIPYLQNGGNPLNIRLTCIDSGYDAPAVYQFCRKRLDVLRPIKGGNSHQVAPIKGSYMDSVARKRKSAVRSGLMLYTIDTSFFKDRLSRMIGAESNVPGGWHLFRGVGNDYYRQMCSEVKVIERNKRTGAVIEEWKLAAGHRDNHYWDAEVYCLVAAEMLRAGVARTKVGIETYAARGSAERSPHWQIGR